MKRKKIVTVTMGNLSEITKMKNVVFRAYKYSLKNGRSPIFTRASPVLTCKKGAVLRVPTASKNKRNDCGRGVNVATEQYCRTRAYDWEIFKLWLVEFRPKDIACVPTGSFGKFRLFRCKVLRSVSLIPDFTP